MFTVAAKKQALILADSALQMPTQKSDGSLTQEAAVLSEAVAFKLDL